MSTERKGVEFFVGLFLLIGFGVIAAMAVTFGRAGRGMQDNYQISVRFPNASGLVKGSDVLLSGARIGQVTRPPTLTGERYDVEVELSLRNAVKIPRSSAFQIRSSGMLGDSYVDVHPPAEFSPDDFAQPGDHIVGLRTGGLDDLTSKGGVMMDTLNKEVLVKVTATLDEIKATTSDLRGKLLSETNLKNVEETFANLRQTTEDFAKTARSLDLVVTRTQAVVDSANGTMKTVDGAAGDLRLALGDLRKTSDSARGLLTKATTGEGPMGMLISDKQAAEDLRALIANLRRSGVLFYKNRPIGAAEPAATPPPIPRRR